MSIIDAGELKRVWMGSAVASSDNPDPTVSSQVVVQHIVRRLPACNCSVAREGTGYIGVLFTILTNDGDSYYPTVLHLISQMPAAESGMKRYDMITSINGVNTRNKSFSEALAMLNGRPGEEVVVEVKRPDKIRTYTMHRQAW